MKKITKHNIYLIITLTLIAISMLGITSVFASQQQQQQQQQQRKQYTVRWPDGTTQGFNDLETAEKVADSWKELARGTSDANGQLVMKDWIATGKIKVKEIQAPKGYIIDDSNPKEAIVSDKEVTFINKKSDAFQIRKMDQFKEPLAGVEFSVKGKPTLKLEREVIIQKIHKTNGPQPIIEEVLIHIEGPEVDEYFSPTREENSKKLTLKPGTYKVSETKPKAGSEELTKVYSRQSFLLSYEFTLKDDGSITSGDASWGWLETGGIKDPDVHEDPDIPEYLYYRPGSYFSEGKNDNTEKGVSLEGNIITITNYTEAEEPQEPEPEQPPKWK